MNISTYSKFNGIILTEEKNGSRRSLKFNNRLAAEAAKAANASIRIWKARKIGAALPSLYSFTEYFTDFTEC